MPHINDPLLQAYIDGFCNDDRVREVESHVQSCTACRERLESARAAVQRASQLLSALDSGPVHAPAFEDLRARAAARARADDAGALASSPSADEREAGSETVHGPAAASPAATQPFWRRPALAWAATLVIAFGLGWLARSVPEAPMDVGNRPALPQEGLSGRAAELEEGAAGEAAAREDLAVLGEVDDSRAQSTPSTPGLDQTEPSGPPAATADEESEPRRKVTQNAPVPDPAVSSELRAATAKTSPDVPAGQRQAIPEILPAVERPAEAEPRMNFALEEAEGQERNEQFATTFADLSTVPGFVPVSLEQLEPWLGAAPRQIPDLTLLRAEVAPGALVTDGLSGRNVVRLLYRDEGGKQIVLLQQYAGPLEGGELTVGDAVSAAGRGAAATAPLATERGRAAGAFRADAEEAADPDALLGGVLGLDLPAVVRQPGQPTTYRWLDADGYLLSITADLDTDTLRGLATLVR